MLKDDINKVGFPFSDTVVDPITVNDGLPIFSLSDIIVPRQKAEAILAVLVVSCLRLNSSCDVLHRNQDIVQPLFAAVYFFQSRQAHAISHSSLTNETFGIDTQGNGLPPWETPYANVDSI
jgi:hypothetical protein